MPKKTSGTLFANHTFRYKPYSSAYHDNLSIFNNIHHTNKPYPKVSLGPAFPPITVWFQTEQEHATRRWFPLFSQARDKLRAETKCNTVHGRRINIFLYSPRTHFSSVKHALIINLLNTHTTSAGSSSHPPIQTHKPSCHCWASQVQDSTRCWLVL